METQLDWLNLPPDKDEAPTETPGPAPAPAPSTPAVMLDPFDPAPLAELFDRFSGQIEAMAAEAATVVVTNDAERLAAETKLGEVKQVAKAIETARKEAKEPYLKAGQQIDGFARPLTERLGQIEQMIRGKASAYAIAQAKKAREEQARLDAERREQERKEREAYEAQRRDAEAAAKAAADAGAPPPPPPPPPPAPVIAPPPQVTVATQTETLSATVETEWTWELQDPRSLPVEIWEERWTEVVKALSPAINRRVKGGIHQIPGVRIYEQEVYKDRAKARK